MLTAPGVIGVSNSGAEGGVDGRVGAARSCRVGRGGGAGGVGGAWSKRLLLSETGGRQRTLRVISTPPGRRLTRCNVPSFWML